MIGVFVTNSGTLSRGRIFPASAMDAIACFWVILVFTNVVLGEHNFYPQGRYGKRETPADGFVPFIVGSRYGRSAASSVTPAKTVKKPSDFAPWFPGSRYGKRSSQITEESTDNRLPLLDRLKAVLAYLDRVRPNQHRPNQNDETQRMYYDNGYDEVIDGSNEKPSFSSM